MIKWTDEQKAKIWRLYAEEMLSFAQIAQRYSHLGVTRSAIAGLIGRIHMARDQEVENEIETKERIKKRLKFRNKPRNK